MVHLLDANVLIALSDTLHEHHARAVAWFTAHPRPGWATCAITENAFVRILGHRNYPNFRGGTGAARGVLQALCLQPGHQYWGCDVSLVERDIWPQLPDSGSLTDAYLLGLAVSRHGRLATLDHAIKPSAVTGGNKALVLIP